MKAKKEVKREAGDELDVRPMWLMLARPERKGICMVCFRSRRILGARGDSEQEQEAPPGASPGRGTKTAPQWGLHPLPGTPHLSIPRPRGSG